MKLKLLRGLQRELREPFGEKGTSKINTNQPKVPLVPLVPSIISLACAGRTEGYNTQKVLGNTGTVCKLEGTEGTKGTRCLQILVLRFPLQAKGSLSTPLEASI
jgi:hypothetical protein